LLLVQTYSELIVTIVTFGKQHTIPAEGFLASHPGINGASVVVNANARPDAPSLSTARELSMTEDLWPLACAGVHHDTRRMRERTRKAFVILVRTLPRMAKGTIEMVCVVFGK
jgi:hypothetical protein